MRLANQDYRFVLLPALIAIVLVIVGRALAIYPLSLLFTRSSLRISSKHQPILFWGGLRGALALAWHWDCRKTVGPRSDHCGSLRRGRVFYLRAGLTMKP